ncbi:DNA alkylation repair protein [Micromonospora sp. URMC 103]|uniref:DNA alkylation repair protein n=1 Tax=Micromonospora sp. URMC 103 TaxID=3423406 RepID=UPI003F1C8E8D
MAGTTLSGTTVAEVMAEDAEELRVAWSADPDPVVASAGWALTTERVARKPAGLDLSSLLDVIEAELRDAPDRLQWAMNHCLAQIGIAHAEHRARAIAIGERLEVLKDYPTPAGCTSPFAPVWITEVVRRQDGGPRPGEADDAEA